MGSTCSAEGAGECAAVEKLRMGAKGGGGGKSTAFEGWTIGTAGSGESASIVDSRMGVENADKRSAVEGATNGEVGVGSSVATKGKFIFVA